MLSRQVTTDVQPRVRNGHPAQSTTGVARANCSQALTSGLTGSMLPSI